MKSFQEFPPQYLPILVTMLVMAFAVILLVYCFYLSNLYFLLKTIRPENRHIKPGRVWLVLLTFMGSFFEIPQLLLGAFEGTLLVLSTTVQYGIQIFILVFQFYMVNKIADSIETEYRSRSLSVEPRPTFQLGLIMCVCNVSTLVMAVPVLGFLGIVGAFGGFVAWVLYWVKTAEWKNKIKFLPPQNDSTLFRDLY